MEPSWINGPPEPEHCPYCPDQGWYVVIKTGIGYGGPDDDGNPIPIPIPVDEQEQCEFCLTNPNSWFWYNEWLDKNGKPVSITEVQCSDKA